MSRQVTVPSVEPKAYVPRAGFVNRLISSYIMGASRVNKPSMLEKELDFLVMTATRHFWLGDSPLGKSPVDYGKQVVNNEYQCRDAIACIRTLASRGQDCGKALPMLLDMWEKDPSHVVRVNAGLAIERIALSGADLTDFMPRVLQHSGKEFDALSSQADAIAFAVSVREKILADKVSYITRMEQKLFELVSRFEKSRYGALPSHLIVVDASTSVRFICDETRIFKADSEPEVLGYDFPREPVAATAHRHVTFGRITLWRANIEQDKFDVLMFHELSHLLRNVEKCLRILGAKLRREYGKEKGSYLLRIIDEGLAEYLSKPSLSRLFGPPGFEGDVESVLNAVHAMGWAFVAADERYKRCVYSIGENFFFEAMLRVPMAPVEVMERLSRFPPSAEELLSKDGGRKWAARAAYF